MLNVFVDVALVVGPINVVIVAAVVVVVVGGGEVAVAKDLQN